MTVELLPGARLSPEVLLHQCLQSMDGVKGVIVLKIDENGAIDISMSNVTLTELAYASLNLQIHTQEVVAGRPPEGTEIPAPGGA